MAREPSSSSRSRFGIPQAVRDTVRRHRRPQPLWYVGPLERETLSGVDSEDKSGPRRANDRAHGHRGKDPQ